ncbi:MAG: M1 family metallopeptidase, partial [Myxococcota bacterium]
QRAKGLKLLFEGRLRIELDVVRPTSTVVIHAAELTIERARIRQGNTAWLVKPVFRAAPGADGEPHEVVFSLPRQLAAGENAVLEVGYRGRIGETLRGMYRVRDDAGRAFLFTQLEPSDARRVLPSFDEPGFKVPLALTVVAPAALAVFANTEELSEQPAGEGMTLHRFAPTRPLPTYLYAFAVGPLEARTTEGGDSTRVRVVGPAVAPAQAASASTLALRQLDLLTSYFGRSYPFSKLDLVAVPNFGPGAMENPGLVTFREELLLPDPGGDSPRAARRRAAIMAHELAHQWFGNLVTIEWWDDLWLNEGFATFTGTKIVEQFAPEHHADLELQLLIGRVMGLDAHPSARRVRQPVVTVREAEEAFDGITYIKGAAILRMLERWLGEESFRGGVRSYLDMHADGNAEAGDLFDALASAGRKDVAPVARSFVDQAGLPLVRVEVKCEGEETPTARLTQSVYRGVVGGPGDDKQWRIPVCLGVAGQEEPVCSLLTNTTQNVPLPGGQCPAWVHPNLGYAGYYRSEVAGEELAAAFAEHVRNKMGTRDQVGYLSDAWALVQAGRRPVRGLVRELAGYGGTSRSEVLDQVAEIVERIDDAFVDESNRASFQSWVSAWVMPRLRRNGFRPGSALAGRERELHLSSLKLAAYATTDPWLQAQAEGRAKAVLGDRRASVDEADALALVIAARAGSLDFVDLQAALDAEPAPQRRIALVRSLGALADGDAFARGFGLLKAGGIRAQDALYWIREAAQFHDNRRRMITLFADDLEALKAMPLFIMSAVLSSVRRECDGEERGRVKERFGAFVGERGGSRRLAEALDHVDQCADLRGRYGGDVRRTLFEKARAR